MIMCFLSSSLSLPQSYFQAGLSVERVLCGSGSSSVSDQLLWKPLLRHKWCLSVVTHSRSLCKGTYGETQTREEQDDILMMMVIRPRVKDGGK